MGTRSLIRIFDHSDEEIVVVYRQHDGYPETAGADIKTHCPHRLVDGVSSYKVNGTANGMGCAAATLVKGLKDGIGGIYLHAAGTCDAGEEFEYQLKPRDGLVHMEVIGYGMTRYDGPLSEFDPDDCAGPVE